MIELVLNILLIWGIVGFVSAFLDLFVYFRGMNHMIQCHICHKDADVKKLGLHMLKHYTDSKLAVHIMFFLIYTLLGPFTTCVLIADFFRFSSTTK